MIDERALPCPACGNRDYQEDKKQQKFGIYEIYCDLDNIYDGGCQISAKIEKGESPTEAWNRICRAAAKAFVEAEGLRKVEWLPIDTAPKDGTEILIFVPVFQIGKLLVKWNLGGWHTTWDDTEIFAEPSHWMPTLPDPVKE